MPGSEKRRPKKLDAPRAVADERCQTPADTEIEPRLRVHAVRQVHVIALVVSHHLEGELVMISKKKRPLAAVGYGWGALHGLHERVSIFEVQRHEDARHDREVIRHVTFVAFAEVRPHILATGSLRRAASDQEPSRLCASGLP